MARIHRPGKAASVDDQRNFQMRARGDATRRSERRTSLVNRPGADECLGHALSELPEGGKLGVVLLYRR